MTITTLEYIHRLLQAEEYKTNEVYKSARRLQHDYEDSETPDKELIKNQTEAADEFMRKHSRAWDALRDFEEQER